MDLVEYIRKVTKMDLQKIGKFIAQLRKEKAMTQEQLGEALHVSNKTVSRWETGTYLPPADALLEMSGLFQVSVNELLTGKRLSQGEYRQAAEENLAQAVSESRFTFTERVAFFKRKWLKDHIAVLVVLSLGILGVTLAGVLLKKPMVSAAGILLLAVCHGWRNNAMMAYVEQKAYDGTGMEK